MIDSRTTNNLFKAEAFWNGFGFFATYEHANLLRDAVGGHLNAYLYEIKRQDAFEKKLEEAISFVKLLLEGKEDALEREIGDDVQGLSLRNPAKRFVFVELASTDTLAFLEGSLELPREAIRQALEHVMALQAMLDSMDETLNEGVNRFDEADELTRVKGILHEAFEPAHLDEILAKVKKEPVDGLSRERLKQDAIRSGEVGRDVPQPLYEMVFEAIQAEKEKLGLQ